MYAQWEVEMKRFQRFFMAAGVAALAFVVSCDSGDTGVDDGSNPFLEDQSNPGKEDSAYQNPDGIEVEVDLEGDVEGPAYRIFDAPVDLGQYVMTYFRNRDVLYLESLAELAGSEARVEWRVGDQWLTSEQAHGTDAAQLRHFRLRGLNAVLLHSHADRAQVGQVFEAEVPVRPYSVMSDAGNACADPDDHMTLDQSIYWYQWNPDREGCNVATQRVTVTISRLFQTQETTYPEYDLLAADNRITAVILFGQIGDGAVNDQDAGVRNMNRFARWLSQAGFQEVTPAPVGRRFSKTVGAVTVEIDLYSPYDFSGLSDMAHFGNFQRALSEHEIVAYDGHSMLGASDFWSRPDYPDFYQIYLYGGCLGYEYYLQPILNGHGGWEQLDIVSSVVEVSADANAYAGAFMAKLLWALEHNNDASWDDMLRAIRQRVGDSTFGASGVRDNCYTPTGSRCGTVPDPTNQRFESTGAVSIPDNDATGARSVIEVPGSVTSGRVSIELSVTHTWVGDLRIVLEHGGTQAVLWDAAGGSDQNIHQTFTPEAFAGSSPAGAWTLTITDTAAQDVGTLDSWAVIVTP
jgi:hypothetical protein